MNYSFTNIVIVVALLVFIGLVITILFLYQKRDSTFAPIMTDCPDYWKLKYDKETKTTKCVIPAEGEINRGKLKSRPVYLYDNVGPNKYSRLPTYYDPRTVRQNNGMKTTRTPEGYYNTQIPHGYDENHPEENTINFNDDGWATFGDPTCEIQKWAKQWNIQWDGLNSYSC